MIIQLVWVIIEFLTVLSDPCAETVTPVPMLFD
jgi:hypothetical protein